MHENTADGFVLEMPATGPKVATLYCEEGKHRIDDAGQATYVPGRGSCCRYHAEQIARGDRD